MTIITGNQSKDSDYPELSVEDTANEHIGVALTQSESSQADASAANVEVMTTTEDKDTVAHYDNSRGNPVSISFIEPAAVKLEVCLNGKSPWSSILDLLKQNKCWLCMNVFPRGKTKNVFQVYHLLDLFEKVSKYYKSSKDDDSNLLPSEGLVADENASKDGPSTSEPNFVSPNLRACYYEYVRSGGPEKLDSIVDMMRNSCELEVWMSGLVCNNETCVKEFKYIVPDDDNGSGGASMGSSTKLSANQECPPGCGCDNPWAFISS